MLKCCAIFLSNPDHLLDRENENIGAKVSGVQAVLPLIFFSTARYAKNKISYAHMRIKRMCFMALPSDRISPVKFLPANVEGEPIYNALNSLALLNVLEQLPNLPPWIVRSAEALTPERREENRLVFEGLGYILTPERDYPDFPAYINDLAEADPIALRDRHLSRLVSALPGPLEYGNAILSVEPDSLLRNVQSYISYIKQLNPTLPIDPIIQQKAYHLLLDPEALQKTLVAHLRLMWKALLAPEWKRVQRSLQS
jgi:hypothetical protein